MKKYLISVLAVLLFAGQASAYWGTMKEKVAAPGAGAVSASPFTDTYFHADFVERIPFKITYPVDMSCSSTATSTKFIAATTPQTRVIGLLVTPTPGSATEFLRLNIQGSAYNTYGACWNVPRNLGPVFIPLDLWQTLGVSVFAEATSPAITGASLSFYQYLSSTSI